MNRSTWRLGADDFRTDTLTATSVGQREHRPVRCTHIHQLTIMTAVVIITENYQNLPQKTTETFSEDLPKT